MLENSRSSEMACCLLGRRVAAEVALVVVAVVIFNVVIGIVEESKAADAVAALAEMTQAQSLVCRDGGDHRNQGGDTAIADVPRPETAGEDAGRSAARAWRR